MTPRRAAASKPASKPGEPPTGKRHALSISDPGRFIYVRTAKVATRSLSAAFDARPDLEVVMHQGRLKKWPQGPRRHYTAFAFVRNPFTRLVSCWQDKVIGIGTWQLNELAGQSFPEFVTALEGMDLALSDRHVRPQTALLPLDRLDFLGRLETMQADWERVCALLGLGELPLPRQHESKAAPEPVRLDEAMAERIRRLYALDFAMFGYDTGVPERLR